MILLETIIIISTVSGGYLEKALFLLCLSQMKLFSSLITVVSLSIFFPLQRALRLKNGVLEFIFITMLTFASRHKRLQFKELSSVTATKMSFIA